MYYYIYVKKYGLEQPDIAGFDNMYKYEQLENFQRKGVWNKKRSLLHRTLRTRADCKTGFFKTTVPLSFYCLYQHPDTQINAKHSGIHIELITFRIAPFLIGNGIIKTTSFFIISF